MRCGKMLVTGKICSGKLPKTLGICAEYVQICEILPIFWRFLANKIRAKYAKYAQNMLSAHSPQQLSIWGLQRAAMLRLNPDPWNAEHFFQSSGKIHHKITVLLYTKPLSLVTTATSQKADLSFKDSVSECETQLTGKKINQFGPMCESQNMWQTVPTAPLTRQCSRKMLLTRGGLTARYVNGMAQK